MKVGIVFGGQSFEHEISIVSAMAMKEVIKGNLSYIFVDAHRQMYLIPQEKMKSSLFSSGAYKKLPLVTPGHGGFFQKTLFGQQRIECDVVLNLVHGGDGEDGKLASLFEFFGIPFIGPRKEACVMSFNKYLTKLYAQGAGVKTLPYELLTKGASRTIHTSYPVIVKPARLGSSIGVSVVKDANELDYALDVAFEFDDLVLIEPFVAGVKEYNQAGCKAGEYIFSIIEEPQKNEFLDFEKKYMDFSRTQRAGEASLDDELKSAIRKAFRCLYDNYFEGSIIRCDFFVIDGEVYLNEINPIPGSMANYLFADFHDTLTKLAHHLPKPMAIKVDYAYIHSIQHAKGK